MLKCLPEISETQKFFRSLNVEMLTRDIEPSSIDV